MITGIGIDIIEISRIAESLREYGDTFAGKLFTDREREYCISKANPAQHYAARFAAKEAFSKAIGTGWSGEFEWKRVEVMNNDAGKPELVFFGKMASLMAGLSIHLSLSHSNTAVVACVVIERTSE
ncbi:MAG: holo-ACP synthase [Ignavibacteriales bacterium]|nr:holo-ACP synthase [Ignavibacteriales bacterium]